MLSTIRHYHRLRYDRLLDCVASQPVAVLAGQADADAYASAADEIIEACHRVSEEYGRIAAMVKPSGNTARALPENEGSSAERTE